MEKIYRTAIIGGGAAGLMSAVTLTHGENAFSGDDLIVIEKNDRVGKKLVATGNGQGNLTNANITAENYYGDKAFIENFINQTKSELLREQFDFLGIPLLEQKDGKIYPLSKQANSVLDIIRSYLNYKGVKESTQNKVNSITKKGDLFLVNTLNGVIKAQSVILATGGAAAKQFGTDGSSYALAENFGHKKTQIYPSLVQLKTDLEKIRGLKGLKETARVTAVVDGREVKSAVGDLLFTEFGVSGNAVFSVSAAVTDKKDAKLIVEFLPHLSQEKTQEILENRNNSPFIGEQDLLTGVINKRIGQAVMKTVRDKTPKSVATALKNFTLSVTGNLGFNYAQVTKGGIVSKDIDTKTYQSKIVKDLYIVGEMLDIDGDCGGYNLTFAFISGIVAANSIKSSLSKGNNNE